MFLSAGVKMFYTQKPRYCLCVGVWLCVCWMFSEECGMVEWNESWQMWRASKRDRLFCFKKKKKKQNLIKSAWVRAWEWATSNACTAVTVVHVWSFLQHTCRGRKVALKCGTLEIAWCCHILSGPRWVLWQWGETLTATLAAAEKKSVGDGDRMTCCYVTEIKLMLTES